MATTNTTTRKPTIEATFENEGTTLVLTFDNGEEIRLHESEMSREIRAHAMMHGFKQKLVDAGAIARNPDTGRSASTDDKYAAVREVYDRLLTGQWNKGRADGESSGAGGLLFRALCVIYPNRDADTLREWLAGKSKEEQAALRATPKVAAEIDRIKAASPKVAKVDTDALLGELGDD
jgi:hypothetical protein